MEKAWKEKSLPGFTRCSTSELSVWSQLPSLPLPHLSDTGSKATAPLTMTDAQIQRGREDELSHLPQPQFR